MTNTTNTTAVNVTVAENSHPDHLSADMLAEVLGKVGRGESRLVVDFGGFKIFEVETSAPVLCALVGPTTGGEPVAESAAFYAIRGEGRPNLSRMVDQPATESRTVTVLVGGIENGAGSLVTAYGGPLAPQEPGDPFLAAEKHAASVAFWAEHALTVEGSPTPVRQDGADFAAFAAPAPPKGE
jgi:hypothetical protein